MDFKDEGKIGFPSGMGDFGQHSRGAPSMVQGWWLSQAAWPFVSHSLLLLRQPGEGGGAGLSGAASQDSYSMVGL